MHRTQPDGDPTRSGERAADLLQGQVGLPGNQLQHRRAVLAQPAATVAAHRARARMALALQLHFWRGVLIFSRMVGRGWMSGASIEETLELWAASLREEKGRRRPLFTQEGVAVSAGLFLDGLLGRSGARQAGCGPRRRVIPVPGGSRRSWGGAAGMPMLCAILCASMRSNTWQRMTRFWSLTRPVF